MSYASSTPAMAPSGNSIGLAASIRAFKRCALRAAPLPPITSCVGLDCSEKPGRMEG